MSTTAPSTLFGDACRSQRKTATCIQLMDWYTQDGQALKATLFERRASGGGVLHRPYSARTTPWGIIGQSPWVTWVLLLGAPFPHTVDSATLGGRVASAVGAGSVFAVLLHCLEGSLPRRYSSVERKQSLRLRTRAHLRRYPLHPYPNFSFITVNTSRLHTPTAGLQPSTSLSVLAAACACSTIPAGIAGER